MGGGVQDTIAAQMQRDGVELPRNLVEQPKLEVSLMGYLDAFYELDTERSHGPGQLVRIPWSRIVAYGTRYNFDVEELVSFIRQIDDAHLEVLRKDMTNGGPPGTREIVQRPPRPDH